MKISSKDIKEIVLVALSLIYLLNSFKIGFWITGDMHSGGPFAGVLLFPFFLSVAALLFFWKEKRVRIYAGITIAVYSLAALTLTFLL